MSISREEFNELEKRIADLEKKIQGQRVIDNDELERQIEKVISQKFRLDQSAFR